MMIKHPDISKYLSEDDLKVARKWQFGAVAFYGSIIVAMIFLSSAFDKEQTRIADPAAQALKATASHSGTPAAAGRNQTAAATPQRAN